MRPSLRRRSILAAIVTGGLGASRSVIAADPPSGAKVYRIGVLDAEPELHVVHWDEFVAELARRGFVVGRNLAFDRRIVRARRPDEQARAAAELVAAKVDVLYAARGTESALALKQATSSIPIVFFSSADPVGIGLVSSLARPGGNVTGSSATGPALASKGLELLVEVLGRRTVRIVQIQPRRTRQAAWFPAVSAALDTTSRRLGVRYEYAEVDSAAEIDGLLKRYAGEGVDAIVFESLTVSDQEERRIADRLLELRLPSTGGDVEKGFLLAYDADWLELARIAAQNVDRILRGTPPDRLPVQQPSAFELAINLRTARAIGLTVPESIVLRAQVVVR